MPPSDFGLENPDFPRAGTLSDRVKATNFVISNLMSRAPTNMKVINFSKHISENDGSLKREYTRDGVHINSKAAEILMKSIE